MVKKKLPKKATNKILKSLFTAKLTKTELLFSLIFIIILFSGLELYFLYNQTGIRLRAEAYTSIQIIEGNYSNYLQSLTLTPAPMPTITPVIVADGYPPATPIATPPKLVVPNISPDKLIVFRPEDKIDNLPELTRTITDPIIIKKLYDEVYSLPLATGTGTIHCPIEFFTRYTLIFSLQGNIVFQATFNPTGCRFIQVFQGQTRWALSQQGSQFIQDLQNALLLSHADFYGSQNGRPL